MEQFNDTSYIYGMINQVKTCIDNVQRAVGSDFMYIDRDGRANIEDIIKTCNMLLNSQQIPQAGGNRNKKLTKKNKNKNKH